MFGKIGGRKEFERTKVIPKAEMCRCPPGENFKKFYFASRCPPVEIRKEVLICTPSAPRSGM